MLSKIDFKRNNTPTKIPIKIPSKKDLSSYTKEEKKNEEVSKSIKQIEKNKTRMKKSTSVIMRMEIPEELRNELLNLKIET